MSERKTREEALEETRASLFARQADYQQTFTGEPQARTLADLAAFCRANQSTFHPNPHVAARLDGRREVWLRIQDHLRLSPEQLWDLYSKPVRS